MAAGSLSARLPGLDLLRALAIAWVMLYHLASYGVALPGVVQHGWMGVDLFFVLSGYLIGGQLLRPCASGARPSWRGFMLKRALRVLPAYLAVLGIYAAFPAVRENPAMRPLWQFLSFSVNLLPGADRLAFSHAWSLCVEEHFYLLLPAAVWLLARHPGPRRTTALVLALLLSLLLGGMLLRGWLWHTGVEPFAGDPSFLVRYVELVYNPTWTRLDGLLAGVVLALVQVFRPGWWAWAGRRQLAFGLAGAAGIVLACRMDPASGLGAVLVFPLAAAGFACMVLAAAAGDSWLNRLRVPGVAPVAALAFSLYLTHKAVFDCLHAQFGNRLAVPDGVATLLYLAAALAVAAVLYLAVERPCLRWRDRIVNAAAQGRRAPHGMPAA